MWQGHFCNFKHQSPFPFHLFLVSLTKPSPLSLSRISLSLSAPPPSAATIHCCRSSFSFAGIPLSHLATVPLLRFNLFLRPPSLTPSAGISFKSNRRSNPLLKQSLFLFRSGFDVDEK
ncbi:hypothetical protein MtrunA17_Chr1g0204261 [Medicago truncatula]|uniref:Uncharacterized protein n=1 Tax=Medicago truncatula TaxID=3880 RepID=A0A396JUD8_MEDTR|nr:hypothetical protein MtrunA17_Chr1g0204261 [Medicago truncatula]